MFKFGWVVTIDIALGTLPIILLFELDYFIKKFEALEFN